MKVFDQHIAKVRSVVEQASDKHSFTADPNKTWNKLPGKQLIMASDTACELGSPKTQSTAFLLFTTSKNQVEGDRITLVGDELAEQKVYDIPFAKVILVEIDEAKALGSDYDTFKSIESVKNEINLEGFMIRSMRQTASEWSRVSKQAMQQGFSFEILFNELMRHIKTKDFVKSVEIIGVAGGQELINQLVPLGKEATEMAIKMNTIFSSEEEDCGSCGIKSLCNEIDGMKKMHQKQVRRYRTEERIDVK